jgi:hypothetical protein
MGLILLDILGSESKIPNLHVRLPNGHAHSMSHRYLSQTRVIFLIRAALLVSPLQ